MAKRKAKITKGYAEYTTTKTKEVVKIFPIPQQILSGIRPDRPKPEKPTIVMKTKTGTQSRPAKEGDEGWDEWQEDLKAWEAELSELEEATSLVLALREYPVNDTNILEIDPSELEFPNYMDILVKKGQFSMPDNEFKLKALWLQEFVVGQNDELEISWELRKLNGEPEDLIEQIKATFRDRIYGQILGSVESVVNDNSNGTKKSVDQQPLLEAIEGSI